MSRWTTERRSSLLGADFDDVRAQFGVPLAGESCGGVLRFAYPGGSGVIDDAVVVVDGVVVRVSPYIRHAPEVHGAKALVGAHVEEVASCFGPLRRLTTGIARSELEFDGAIVTVYDGWILGVRLTAPVTTAR